MTLAEAESARAPCDAPPGLGGFQVVDVLAHEDRWDKLPR